jgi:tetratricopeptide (TPR) repeat protein
MNRRLLAWLSFGALQFCPLTVRGQQINPRMSQRTNVNEQPILVPDPPPDVRRGPGAVVSIRELGIPDGAKQALKKGLERLGKDDPAGSLVYLQRAVSEFSGFYEAYYAMGVAHLCLKHHEEAERAFQQSIDNSGGHYAAPHFGMAFLFCDQQKYAEAEPLILKGMELSPGFSAGYFTLAWAQFGLGRLDDAEKNAREAIVRVPALAPAHLLLAKVYDHRSDYSAELAELDAYLRLEPNGAAREKVQLHRESIVKRLTTP